MEHPLPSRRLTVGWTIPLTLVLVALTEIALRTVPLERFAFRSLEALASPDQKGGPFLPNRRYEKSRTYGDLAGTGNLRSLRQYRREIFTTDRWGYRNADRIFGDPPAAMLIGDSFGIAPGVVDSETLPAHLHSLWGRSVYNAAGMFRMNDAELIRELARKLGMRNGLVIHEFLERQSLPVIRPPPLKSRAVHERSETSSPTLLDSARQWWTSCRLRILTERIYRVAQNDRFLPNSHRANVEVKRLVNGEEILFFPGDLWTWTTRRPVNADFWRWLKDELGRDGHRLVVLLVPNKYTVYAPLLDPPTSDGAGMDHLERLEKVLKEAGIDVVNLKGVYRDLARRDLERGSYLYWRDDTHWTGRAMRVAAEELTNRGFGRPGRSGKQGP